MAQRTIIWRQGESYLNAVRRDESEAPYGRCGDHAKPGEYQGCGTPLGRKESADWYVCSRFPDCCRP